MQKRIIIYLLFALMLATSVTYFTAASFGENLEVRNHEAKAAESGHVNLEGTPQHGAGENSQVTTSGGEHGANDESAVLVGIQGGHRDTETNQGNMTKTQQEATEKANGLQENSMGIAESSNESTKRSVELPLFLTAGVAYILVGFWMLKDNESSRIPYIIAMAGSLVLIGLYTTSHTVGMPLIGLEHIGVLDLLVAALQVGIVGCSSYVLLSRSQKRITASAERSL